MEVPVFKPKIKRDYESDLEAYLVKQCKVNNVLCKKLVFSHEQGAPDRILLYDSRVYFVELKAADGALRPNQRRIIKELALAGFTTFIPYLREHVDYIIEGILNNTNFAKPIETFDKIHRGM